MPRAIWTGAISFGLVTVPVKLYSATSSKTVRFHNLHDRDGVRLRQKRICPADGEEVAYEHVVKGYEIAPDRYVVISQDELDGLDPKATKTIDIEDFVDLAQIDPIQFDHAYYLLPATGAAKPYRLLLEAMDSAGKAGIARVVLRTKQQLCALRAAGEVIAMSTMLYHDEVVDPDRFEELESAAEVETTEREREMARSLVDSLAGSWEPERYRDTYRDRVLELIERKAAGEEIAVQPEAEPADARPGPHGGARGEPRRGPLRARGAGRGQRCGEDAGPRARGRQGGPEAGAQARVGEGRAQARGGQGGAQARGRQEAGRQEAPGGQAGAVGQALRPLVPACCGRILGRSRVFPPLDAPPRCSPPARSGPPASTTRATSTIRAASPSWPSSREAPPTES